MEETTPAVNPEGGDDFSDPHHLKSVSNHCTWCGNHWEFTEGLWQLLHEEDCPYITQPIDQLEIR